MSRLRAGARSQASGAPGGAVVDGTACDSAGGPSAIRRPVVPRRYSAFSDAMSMEKRYFTSDRSLRS